MILGGWAALARNQVCQLSPGKARFGTTISIPLGRSISTNRLADSRQPLKADQGMVTFDPEFTMLRSASETSTWLRADCFLLQRFLKRLTMMMRASIPPARCGQYFGGTSRLTFRAKPRSMMARTRKRTTRVRHFEPRPSCRCKSSVSASSSSAFVHVYSSRRICDTA